MGRLFSVLLALFLLLPAPLLAADLVASLSLIEPSVTLVRDGRVSDLRKLQTDLFDGDRIETGPDGKAKVTFENGDVTFLGPKSSLDIEARQDSMANWKIKLNLVGKLRALVNKRRDKHFRVRTVSAVIGVKGTDFVTDAPGKTTRVATFKGLVSLTSLSSNQSVDVPQGKQGTINPAGEVMPLSDIAGDILEGVEIAGKQLSTEEAAGEKVCMNC